jgi:hypothetical protein
VASNRIPAAVLAVLAAACGGAGSGAGRAPAHIQVDTLVRHQTMTGWEATAQAGQHDDAAYAVYGAVLIDRAVNELGITRLRLEVRAGAERAPAMPPPDGVSDDCARYLVGNDNEDPFDTDPSGFDFSELDDAVEKIALPMKHALSEHGERLVLNVNYVAFLGQCPAGTPYPHADPEEYGEFVLATYRHMQARWGLVPDLWEVVLEPENTGGRWTGQQIGVAMLATARRLEAAGFTPRFVAPSVTKAGNAPRYFDELAMVPGAMKYLEELSYHRYRGVATGDIEAIAERGRRHGVRTSMLEHIGSGVDALHQDLTAGGVSAWQQYTLAYPKDDDDGAQYYIVDGSAPDGIRLASRSRLLRQYFRFVRPGSTRIGARTTDPRVLPVAFSHPRDGVVVVLRATAALGATLSGLPAGTYGLSYTTEREAVTLPDVVLAQDDDLAASIPASGVLTVFAR